MYTKTILYLMYLGILWNLAATQERCGDGKRREMHKKFTGCTEKYYQQFEDQQGVELNSQYAGQNNGFCSLFENLINDCGNIWRMCHQASEVTGMKEMQIESLYRHYDAFYVDNCDIVKKYKTKPFTKIEKCTEQDGIISQNLFQKCSHEISSQVYQTIQDMTNEEALSRYLCVNLAKIEETCSKHLSRCFSRKDSAHILHLHLEEIEQFFDNFIQDQIPSARLINCDSFDLQLGENLDQSEKVVTSDGMGKSISDNDFDELIVENDIDRSVVYDLDVLNISHDNEAEEIIETMEEKKESQSETNKSLVEADNDSLSAKIKENIINEKISHALNMLNISNDIEAEESIETVEAKKEGKSETNISLVEADNESLKEKLNEKYVDENVFHDFNMLNVSHIIETVEIIKAMEEKKEGKSETNISLVEADKDSLTAKIKENIIAKNISHDLDILNISHDIEVEEIIKTIEENKEGKGETNTSLVEADNDSLSAKIKKNKIDENISNDLNMLDVSHDIDAEEIIETMEETNISLIEADNDSLTEQINENVIDENVSHDLDMFNKSHDIQSEEIFETMEEKKEHKNETNISLVEADNNSLTEKIKKNNIVNNMSHDLNMLDVSHDIDAEEIIETIEEKKEGKSETNMSLVEADNDSITDKTKKNNIDEHKSPDLDILNVSHNTKAEEIIETMEGKKVGKSETNILLSVVKADNKVNEISISKIPDYEQVFTVNHEKDADKIDELINNKKEDTKNNQTMQELSDTEIDRQAMSIGNFSNIRKDTIEKQEVSANMHNLGDHGDQNHQSSVENDIIIATSPDPEAPELQFGWTNWKPSNDKLIIPGTEISKWSYEYYDNSDDVPHENASPQVSDFPVIASQCSKMDTLASVVILGQLLVTLSVL